MNNQESSKYHHFAQLLLTIFMLIASVSALAQSNASACGDLKTHYGPFDYRTDRDKLEIVEGAHFTPEVEALIRGKSSARLGQDLAYTLTHSPIIIGP